MTDRAAWVTRRPSRGDQAFVRIYRWWSGHQIWLLRLAILLMLALSALKLGIEFRRLILEVDPTDAVDLKTRYEELHQWFSGVPIYRVGFVAYPPATYVILWPLLGWLPLEASRWLWALTTVGALAWFAYLIVRESGATTRTERLFVALMLLSMGATGTAIGTGQLTVHSLVAL